MLVRNSVYAIREQYRDYNSQQFSMYYMRMKWLEVAQSINVYHTSTMTWVSIHSTHIKAIKIGVVVIPGLGGGQRQGDTCWWLTNWCKWVCELQAQWKTLCEKVRQRTTEEDIWHWTLDSIWIFTHMNKHTKTHKYTCSQFNMLRNEHAHILIWTHTRTHTILWVLRSPKQRVMNILNGKFILTFLMHLVYVLNMLIRILYNLKLSILSLVVILVQLYGLSNSSLPFLSSC